MHFLLQCSKYHEERNKLFLYLENTYKNFTALSDENEFIWLLTNENEDVIQKLSSFIHTCLEIRKQRSSS